MIRSADLSVICLSDLSIHYIMSNATTSPSASIELLAKDLNENGGVFCPSPKAGMQLWDSHPRVFLDVAHTGSARCPYCGTAYHLRAGEVFRGH